MLYRFLLVPAFALILSLPAEAGLFRKSPKPDPATYVPRLVEMLKSSTDERARVAAANELRDYDAKAFPEILPTLIEALSNERNPSAVRAEAAESIGKVRPVTAQAGYALEQARSNDKAPLLVRAAAQRALFYYRVLGVVNGKEDIVLQTAEPPLADSSVVKANPGSVILRPTPAPIPVSAPVAPPTSPKMTGPALPPGSVGAAPKEPGTFEPPLAEPKKPTNVLTNDPKGPAPVITIPPPPKDAVVPVPTVTKPDAVPPKELPVLEKPPEKKGPSLPPPPGK